MKTTFKIIIVAIFLSLGITQSFAQISRQVPNLPVYNNAPFHVGFAIGGNQMGFAVTMAPGAYSTLLTGAYLPKGFKGDAAQLLEVTPNPKPGITVSQISDLRLNKYFNLRLAPTFAFGERTINYVFLDITQATNTVHDTVSITKRIPSTYVEIPLGIKYRSKRMHNIAAYVYAGGKYSIDFSNQRKKQDAENPGDFTILLKKSIFSYELAAGMDFYTNFFKFGVEAKMAYSLGDILADHNTPYTVGMTDLRSKIFFISFTFE